MTMYLFWEHLDALTAAHKFLEKEYDDLRLEHERVKNILQALQLHEASVEHRASSTTEISLDDAVGEVGIEPSAHAVARMLICKTLSGLDQGKNYASANSIPYLSHKMLRGQSEGADAAQGSSNILCSHGQGKVLADSACNKDEGAHVEGAVSVQGLRNILCSQDQDNVFAKPLSSDDIDVCMLPKEIVIGSATSVRPHTRNSKVGFVESTLRSGSFSDAGTFTQSSSARSAISYRNKGVMQSSIRSVGDLMDLSDIADPLTRWGEMVKIFILYRCRGEYNFLPCWSDQTSQSTCRRLIRNYVAELGAAVQEEEPIIYEWALSGKKMKFMGHRTRQTSIAEDNLFKAAMIHGAQDVGQDHKSPHCVLHPLSAARVIWSSLSLLFVAYDGVMISLMIFDIQSSDVTAVVEWILRVFWMLDVIVCLRTGFYIKSRYESRPNVIARHYLRTWFVLDLVALVPDAFVALMFAGESSGGIFKTMRYMKLIKLLRLARLAKLTVLVTCFLESLNSIYLALLLQMIKSCFLLLFWVHLVGCTWYAIGKCGNNKSNSWIMKAGVEDVKLPQSYFIAIQWALCLLQGSTDVYPSINSTMEGGFTVAAIALSIIMLAVFISNITNALIMLQHTWDDKVKKRRALQDYLVRHHVSPDIAEAVRRYSEENTKIKMQLDVDEDDVTASLPTALRRQLLVQVRGPMVNVKNPVFVVIQRNLPECFDKLCCDLLMTLFVEPDTLVYNYGKHCNQTYFNVAGEVFYDHISNRALDEWLTMFDELNESLSISLDTPRSVSMFSPEKPLKASRGGMSAISVDMDYCERSSFDSHFGSKGMAKFQQHHLQKTFLRERLRVSSIELRPQPICEQALWTTWKHHGDLRTATHTGFLTLESSGFSLLVEHNPTLRSLCACQAIRFCRVLNSGDCKKSDLMTTSDVLNILRSHGELYLCNERRIGMRAGSFDF